MNWFTSDLHVGHFNILRYQNRPFKDIKEMNDKLIDNWNERIQPEDVVYVLGDFAMSRHYDWIIELLNGEKHLIFGNHDKQPQKLLERGFVEVVPEKKIKLGNREVLLNHFPYDNIDPRFEQRKPKDKGLLLLHGHTHRHDPLRLDKRMIDVGVDGHNYYPWSEEEILELIK